jgi:hypothetical protein
VAGERADDGETYDGFPVGSRDLVVRMNPDGTVEQVDRDDLPGGRPGFGHGTGEASPTKASVRFRATNSRNTYYELFWPKEKRPITVVHTAFDTFVCMACRSHRCAHADFVSTCDEVQNRSGT